MHSCNPHAREHWRVFLAYLPALQDNLFVSSALTSIVNGTDLHYSAGWRKGLLLPGALHSHIQKNETLEPHIYRQHQQLWIWALSSCLPRFSFSHSVAMAFLASTLPHFLRPVSGKSAKQTVHQHRGNLATPCAMHEEMLREDVSVWRCAVEKDGCAGKMKLEWQYMWESNQKTVELSLYFLFREKAPLSRQMQNVYPLVHVLSGPIRLWNLKSWHTWQDSHLFRSCSSLLMCIFVRCTQSCQEF